MKCNKRFARSPCADESRLEAADVHRIGRDLVIVQTRWRNPEISPDGKVHPENLNDMIVTYVLFWLSAGPICRIIQLDLHNVVKLANPYPSSITQPHS
jgi:hypothetical protein